MGSCPINGDGGDAGDAWDATPVTTDSVGTLNLNQRPFGPQPSDRRCQCFQDVQDVLCLSFVDDLDT